MKKHRIFTILMGVIVLLTLSSQAFAEGIKDRMKARLPEIVALKSAGIVGETNQGLLDFVGGMRDKVELVSEENADRQKIYEAIGQQQGTTSALVGQRRAKQIAEKAAAGEWLQDGSGNWYAKP